MSRSYKKPYSTITGVESSKKDKQNSNRKFRRINKILVKLGIDKLFNKTKEISDNWSWERDGGKYYWGGTNYEERAKRK